MVLEVRRFAEQKKQEDSRALFAFTDVFLRHDTNKTFAALHRLLLQGESSTSLLNILLWQIRTMVLISQSESASDAGVKPFVYTKTNRALTQFSDPLTTLITAEALVRQGRLQGDSDEEIVERIVLCV